MFVNIYLFTWNENGKSVLSLTMPEGKRDTAATNTEPDTVFTSPIFRYTNNSAMTHSNPLVARIFDAFQNFLPTNVLEIYLTILSIKLRTLS